MSIELLRKTFCDIGKIPISCYDNPHFLNRVHLLNKMYDTDRLWTEFVKSADAYKTPDEYVQHVKSVYYHVSRLIGVRLTPDVVDKATRQIDVYRYRRDLDIFTPDNVGKKFIGIEIPGATFEALKWAGQFLVDSKQTYVEFIRRYTQDRNLICNFDVQKEILGLDTNEELQFVLDALTVDILVKTVLRCFSVRDIMTCYGGQIYIELDQNQGIISYNNLCRILDQWTNTTKIKVNVEVFRIGVFKEIDTYIKRFETGKPGSNSLKIVNPDPATIAFVIRYLNEEPISETDKYFSYKGKTTKFMKVPEINLAFEL